MATVQYRIQIDESLVIELDEMAQEFDEPSGQQIAGRIIRQFLPIYRRIKEAEKSLFREQVKSIEENIETLKQGKEPASKTLPGPVHKRRA